MGEISVSSILQNEQEFLIINLDDSYPSTKIGQPNLPQINQLIEIPYEAIPRIEIVNVNEEIYNLDDFSLDGVIIPTQPSLSKRYFCS